MVAIISIMIAVAAICAALVTRVIHKHEKRILNVGSDAATPERRAHKSWSAVAGTYVYIHNAFQNDLQRIITSCEEDQFVASELERWANILSLHSRIEDEIFVVALKARLKRSNDTLPKGLASGDDHKTVVLLLDRALTSDDESERLGLLKNLAVKLDEHLLDEENTVMPLLLEKFTTQELSALDSFVVNPKLGWCDEECLIDVGKWWFGSISIIEILPLLYPFVQEIFNIGKQQPMPIEEWGKLQKDIPALHKFSTEDIIPT